MKRFGKELAESIKKDKQRTLDIIERRQQRYNNGEAFEDDCFLSEKVNYQTIDECNKKLHILEETDGTMEIESIFDNEGNEIRTHWFKNKFGKWTIVGNGIFANSEEKLLEKTGWIKKVIKVPCWVQFVSNGSGMYGVYTGHCKYVRWHTNMVTGEYIGFPN